MKNKAFTLIEMLVVVLIIGILAAIAVPQYQKAVYKSRAMEAMLLVKALAEAEEVYYLVNGEYSKEIEKLDVKIPEELITSFGVWKFEDKYSYSCSRGVECGAGANNTNMPSFQFNFKQRTDPDAGKFYCNLGSDDSKSEIAKSICQGLGGVVDSSRTQAWAIDKYFILNGVN